MIFREKKDKDPPKSELIPRQSTTIYGDLQRSTAIYGDKCKKPNKSENLNIEPGKYACLLSGLMWEWVEHIEWMLSLSTSHDWSVIGTAGVWGVME